MSTYVRVLGVISATFNLTKPPCYQSWRSSALAWLIPEIKSPKKKKEKLADLIKPNPRKIFLRIILINFCLVFAGDEGGVVSEHDGRVLQQQWVTLTASMWPEPTASTRGWRVSSDRIPLLAAVFCGAALVVCALFAFVIYRCCIMPKKEKHYCKYLRKDWISSISIRFKVDSIKKNGHFFIL